MLEYDGVEDGIFNLSNHTLFYYECILSYFDNMTVSRTPFHAHYREMYMAHERLGAEKSLPSRQIIR